MMRQLLVALQGRGNTDGAQLGNGTDVIFNAVSRVLMVREGGEYDI